MTAAEGLQLSQSIRRKAAEFRELCTGLDERTASRAPEGRWSPKQIVSHLTGAEGGGFVPLLRLFVDQDTPEISLDAGNPHLSERRAAMPMAELLAEFDKESERVAAFVAGLTDAQLSRKAHVADLKETPLGEYPTLAVFIEGIAEGHMAFHIDHMREILQALSAAGERH